MLVSAVVFAIAAATLLTAHAFESLGGYLPCHLCLQERYAYYFAVPAAAVAFFAARRESNGAARVVLLLVALAFVANAAIGVYHSGIEWKWWAGPTECSGGSTIEWVYIGSSHLRMPRAAKLGEACGLDVQGRDF